MGVDASAARRNGGPSARPVEDPRVAEILDHAAVLHSAVDTGRDPHVTPTAFTWTGGALWFVVTRDSLKARMLRRRSRIGLLLRSPRYDLVAMGRAEIIDPLRVPVTRDLDRLVDLPFVALNYTSHNSKHLLGILRDADPEPGLLTGRVIVRVAPRALALVSGPELLATWGRWTSIALTHDTGHPPRSVEVDPLSLPVAVRPLLVEPGPGALAWPTVHGPIPLPARWTGNGRHAEVCAELLTLVGAHHSGPAALSISTGGYRLATKRGVMLRGPGEVGRRGDTAAAALAARRVTWWTGDHTATVQVGGPDPER